MAAFSEMGVMPEIAQAVEELDWLLPTDIQAESIPLILGGGDVLMAAETGSGKTGAFSMPVIQIVYETLKDEQEGKTGRASIKTGGTIFNNWQMNPYDRSPAFAIGPDGLCCQSREFKEWHGCRSTKGVTKGKYYYEVTCHDQGLCRIGWSTSQAALDLGTDKYGFGFGGTGKKSNNKQFDSYGEEFTMHDTIGCYLDVDKGQMSFSKNGNDLGVAFEIPQQLKSQPFFASCVLKNAELKFNFGGEDFKNAPKSGFVAMDQAPEGHAVKSTQAGSAKVSQVKATSNSPKALIIEPSKELAEQTLNNVIQCAKYVDNPKLRNLLVIGGVPAKDQMAALEHGVDIVVGTPGRLDDLISTGKLSLSQVRFLVLDECDGLLSAGYTDFINRIHNQIPQVTSDGKRLQMWSEAIKMLKGEYTVRAIKEHKMDQAIIFCRTKIDCDNMEQYFIQQGGGPDSKSHQLSCVCLHGDRKPNERKTNLERFKKKEVRLLICTDVAARGIDVHGVPYVINVTLPDEKQNYVHRIGRVGRAERMGLAISLVAMEKEKVWYHVCANRGRGCYNTRLKEDGGCTIWYKEKELLSDIEEHLKCTITQCEPDIKVPLDDFDGKVTYGQRKVLGGGNYKGHVDALAPTVLELANLEREAQSSFLHLGYMPNQLFRAF
ncbi:ATP-dependent RNA helicase DDX1 isoform X5 [Trematomus bernacchii]|uniref:ATP-dependent RNA helicase DDX1 isoform X5 n=1 Tax=Trematomus bernacchii TaxID=40690 RepID=UPI00146F5F47|nr:ATP-dependent RNA helicase DDX1 isoform X5 [Trematomus bernacchii]